MQKIEKAGYKKMLFIIVTNNEAFIFVKTYACYVGHPIKSGNYSSFRKPYALA